MARLRLVVEVLHAINLLPGDGEGSTSPYVEVSFDIQRLRTRTKLKDLNPVWNEKFEFSISDPAVLLEEEFIEINVYTVRKAGHRHLLGRAKVKPEHIRNRADQNAHVPIPIPLEKGWSIFTRKRGELYLKVYYYDDDDASGSQGQHLLKGESSSSDSSDVSSECDSVGKGASAFPPEDGSSRRADFHSSDSTEKEKWDSDPV